MGRELQKHYGDEPQVVMMTPIIEGLDGVKKMSKSLNNYIGINESAEDIFGKLMSISDELLWRYMDVLSFKTAAELKQVRQAVNDGLNPRDVKIEFAKEIVARFHDESDAERAHRSFVARFQNKILPDDIETQVVPYEEGMALPLILKLIGLTTSTSESMRLIKQGAVKVEGEKVSDVGLKLAINTIYMIQVGKHRLAKIVLK